MKKILALIVLCVFLFGCPDNPKPEEKVVFKEIPWAEIPSNCTEFKDNVCGLFSCMVESCWCKESPEMIVLEGNTVLQSEGEIKEYFQEKKEEITGTQLLEITNTAKLNPIFWNVFFTTENGEQMLTVAADGTVIETVCGV